MFQTQTASRNSIVWVGNYKQLNMARDQINTRNGSRSLERDRGQFMEGLVGHTKGLRSHCNSKREPLEHWTAGFTFYQAPSHCLSVEGDCECDKMADKGW